MFLLKKYEQYDTFRKKLTLDLANEYGSELPAGTHEFAWSFIVPANTAVGSEGACIHSVH